MAGCELDEPNGLETKRGRKAWERALLGFGEWIRMTRKVKAITVCKYLEAAVRILRKASMREVRLPGLRMYLRRLRGEVEERAPRRPVNSQVVRSLMRDDSVDLGVKVACLVAFHLMLRVSEYAIRTDRFRPEYHLTAKRLTFGDQRVAIRLVTYKNDKWNCGDIRILAETGGDLCPVAWLKKYQRWWRSQGFSDEEQYFRRRGGYPVQPRHVTAAVRQHAVLIGLPGPPSDYSSHSLRIGGATMLAAAGFTDSEIMLLGRWNSNCFRMYTRTVRATVRRAAQAIQRSQAVPIG